MQWNLDKYNRLQDTRNSAMILDRDPLDQLFLQFDQSLHMLHVYHNGNRLEAFFVHPLVFAHDFIRKDQRVLFCIKNQTDGSVVQKFRVRFSSATIVNHFCTTIAKYVGIKAYDDWSSRRSSSSGGGSSRASSVAAADVSMCSSQSDADNKQQQQLVLKPKLVDVATQTEDGLLGMTSGGVEQQPAAAVHVHIQNLSINLQITKTMKATKKRDPNAPKQPKNAFMLWLLENRGRISRSLGTTQMSEVSKRAGREWRALKDKSRWEEMAAEDKARYDREKANYVGRG